MKYQDFIDSLNSPTCPAELEPCLRALWFDAAGTWGEAHEIVQQLDDTIAALIHAYLHRKKGDEGNAKYWHRVAGSVFPEEMTFDEEWDHLVRQLLE